MLWRGISNLLALLIVVSIVVGAGIAISVFLSGFMQNMCHMVVQ